MSDLVVNVRQVSSYPLATSVPPNATLLLQNGGLGSPYMSATAQTLVATALQQNGGPIGVGVTPPSPADGTQAFSGWFAALNGFFINTYFNGTDIAAWQSGPVGVFDLVPGNYPNPGAFQWQVAQGQAGAPLAPLSQVMQLTQAGALSLPHGTLTVARDPSAALEVATMGWVGNHTVASFNGRNGAVQLWSSDIYSALCLDSSIATQNWVNSAIAGAIQQLLMTCPFVNRWNGRTGSVYLMLSDISCVFMQPGQQPITQTPPLTSNDNSIANTQWVVEWVTNELAGGGTNFATQAWVLANTVNSFNGRQGVVTLTSADVYNVGAAPLNSPQFSGIPTAPTASFGQATGQIATTAFVQQAIAGSVAGVASFNTRTGAVTLESADITAAGGLANPSPNLTGNPTAPTQPPGTNLPVIATCQFVMAALAAGAVTSFNTRTGAVTLLLSDVTGVGGAPLASPNLSGTPTAPTAAPATNNTQIATTAFVSAAVAAAGGVSSFNSRTGAITLEANDVSAVGGLINPNVTLTGTPTAPTAAPGTNTTQIASTAFVAAALNGTVTSFNTRTGTVTLQAADITGVGGALLASPAFTGTPTGPTAVAGANNTQLATTAFVAAAIASDTAGVASFNTRTGAVTLIAADLTSAGGALLASPSFSGIPTAPTATAGTSTTQIATTAFVAAAVGAGTVASFNGRTGTVTLQANDLSAVGGALLASPAFSGVPTAPTAAANTSTTQLATTQFVTSAVTLAELISGDNTGRNKADNALIAISQRGVGPFASPGTVSNSYTTDRWVMYYTAGNDTINVSVLSANDANRASIGDEECFSLLSTTFTGGSAANGQVALGTRIENLLRLSNKTVIVSFYANAGAASMRIGIAPFQNFGTGGSPIVLVPGQAVTTSPTVGAFTRLFAIFNIPSIAGKTFGSTAHYTEFNLWYSAGSTNNTQAGGVGVQSGTINMWGFQIEIAQPGQTQPSPLEKLDVGTDFFRCQRYLNYLTFNMSGPASNASSGVGIGSMAIPTTMRVPPSISISNIGYGGTITAATVAANSQGLIGFTGTFNGDGAWATSGNILCSAEL